MKYRLMDILRCPNCRDVLSLNIFLEEEHLSEKKINQIKCREYCSLNDIYLKECLGSISCDSCYKKDIIDGLLKCNNCRSYFPIINGVPRMLTDNLYNNQDFIEKYRNQVSKILDKRCYVKISKPNLLKLYEKTEKSFGVEWKMYQYNKDKTWGWDTETRKNIFLHDLNVTPDNLNNKLVLDAGCGNGVLTAGISDFGPEVVGIDMSHSIERAYQHNKDFAHSNSDFVYFVQGNLLHPPFQKEYFDYIYSSGVLHHTPNTEKAFNSIVPLVKNNGKIYIWLYRYSKPKLVSDSLRRVTTKLPLWMLYYLCIIGAPFYSTIKQILTNLKIGEYPVRTWRENALSLFDTYSPAFAHHHTIEEVFIWFKKLGFSDVSLRVESNIGFGVCGDSRRI